MPDNDSENLKDKVSVATMKSSDESVIKVDEEAEAEKAFEQAGGMSAAITQAFYGEAHISGPGWKVASAQGQAAFMQRLPGISDWTIGNGPGSLSNLTPEERERQQADDDADYLDSLVDLGEREQERQREREEWSRSTHSYAGMEMTGAEWGEFADKLKGDTPLRKWLLEKLKKERQIRHQGKRDGRSDGLARQDAEPAARTSGRRR